MAGRKYFVDDTRFALSLPLRGPLPFTSHGRLAVREGTFLVALFYISKLKKHKLSVKFDDEGGDGRNDGVVRESYDFGGDDVISVAESLSDFRIIRPRKLLPLI